MFRAVFFSFWLLTFTSVLSGQENFPAKDKVNLALRRMADQLLRASGDPTSRIPAIEQSGDFTWRVMMSQNFEYDSLPLLLQTALYRYEINTPYRVAVKKCDDHVIDLGYFQQDFLRDSIVPCMGREEPSGCHYIEITFTPEEGQKTFWAGTGLLLVLTLFTGSGAVLWYRKNTPPESVTVEITDQGWLTFGGSRLHAESLLLESGGHRIKLTYREAKLLRLFVTHPDQLLEREHILNEVWGEDGIQVSRSIDMFVSRLRKKLSADPTVSLVAVHGVGYRMETRNVL